MSKVMYGHDVHTLEANKLAHEARANGWTSLNWIAQDGDMWRLFGVPPERVKTPEKSEPSGRIGPPPPSGMEEITRLSTSLVSAVDAAEKHARENGWDGLVWCSSDEGHVLYGRRAVLVKRPAEQKADGSTIFGAATYPVDTIEVNVDMDADGPPRIRSELGGLMGPGYQATGYEPPPRRHVLLDDPTGDDTAGDVK